MAAAIAVVCLGVFAVACTDDNGGDNTSYTITVQYSDGTAVDGTKSNLEVQICLSRLTGELIQCYSTFKVGTDGKVTVAAVDTRETPGYPELKNNTKYHWQLNNLPEGYTYDEDATYLTAPGDLTITLISENA